MLIVQKYGGSSVANTERILNVARRIANTRNAGHKVVVVLSAQGDVTDELLQKAREISPDPAKRELDMLLATGEQQSVAIMAMALHSLGQAAISLNAVQVGIESTSLHGNARIKRIQTERVQAELEKNNIVLIAGFQGVNRYGDITTLGRGASDTTAVALAAVLGADMCEIYTDVDGVYTADPRKVKSAKKLAAISYDEMLELASLGAQVLHNRAVEMAKRYRVKLVVRSSMTDAEGTLIKEEAAVEKMHVSGVAIDKNAALITVAGLLDRPGVAYQIFSLLAKEKISVDIVTLSVGNGSTQDYSFTVTKDDLEKALTILEANRETIDYNMVSYNDKIAKLSIVGAGMATDFGVASGMFEALYDCGVNIILISTSEIKISVLVEEKYVERAAEAIHDKFFEVMGK